MDEARRRAQQRRRRERRKRRRRRRRILLCFVLLIIVAIAAFAATRLFSGKDMKEGMEYLEQGQYTQAKESFQSSIEKGKNEAEAYRGLGIIYWEEEDYEKSAEAFETALEKGTEETATIYNFLGCCQMKMENWKEALDYLQLGLMEEEIAPELEQEMRFNEVVCLEKVGNLETAKEKAAAYIEQYPEDEKMAKEAAFFQTR